MKKLNIKRALLSVSVSITTALLMAMPAYASAGSGGTDIWTWLDTANSYPYPQSPPAWPPASASL